MAFRVSDGNAIEQIIELSAGYAIGGAVSTALEPLLQSLRNELWTLDPAMPTDAGTLALLVRMGALDQGAAAGEAARSGVGGDSFNRILRAAQAVPDASILLDLYRRRILDAGGLEQALHRAGVDERYVSSVVQLHQSLLGAPDLAMARQQEFIDDAELERRAELVGIVPEDAQLLYRMAGLPPGIETGLELLRRGKIDETRFAEYVAEGHTKTKYTNDLLQLRYQPLSASVAAEALIRERIPEAEAVRIAEENGLRGADFLTWSNMLGRPPGIMEALTLVNRKEMSEPQFREVVARSDVRTEYAPDLLKLRVHYPSLFQMGRLIAEGAVEDARAVQILEFEGYERDLAEGIVKAAHKGKTASHKTISLSIAETLYESGLETREWFDRAIETLGYTADERSELESLLEVRRLVSEVQHALAMLRTRYVGWKIDRTTVVSELDKLLTDPAVRSRLVALWDAEREANRPVLTKAEIGQAFKYGRFTLAQALAAWQAIGLSAEDATTHAWIVSKGNPAPAPAA